MRSWDFRPTRFAVAATVVLTIAYGAGGQIGQSIYNPFTYHTLSPFTSSLFGQTSSKFFYFWQNAGDNTPADIKCGDSYNQACEKSRYRSFDGSCNNLEHPTWGMPNTRYGRLLPATYADGIHAPPRSVTGANLPLSRSVSYTMFPPVDLDDPKWTLAAMQWGQVITHDMALVAGTTQSTAHPTQCCGPDGDMLHPSKLDRRCYPMLVPYNDPVYSKSNIRCLDFVRALTDVDSGCTTTDNGKVTAAEQLTAVTHYLDLSLVYGSNEETARSLRTGKGGRFRVDVRDNREWLPPANNRSSDCELSHANQVCYRAGDQRVNQNPGLSIMHTLLMREHNRVADVLAKLNPHWTDETIFQETRRILIAEHQHISYDEWLPIFLGVKGTYNTRIVYDTNGYVDDYEPTIDPSVLNEHSTAAFRYFHSLIAGHLNLVNEHRQYSRYSSLRLSDHFNRPAVLEEDDNFDDLTRGMSYQPQKASDQFFDREITQYLFRNMRHLGNDLRATDIQRNRDHGLASYNSARAFCGLPRAKTFEDFLDLISEENVRGLASLYASPDDVDLTVGGSLENHVQGTLAGPTFLCIMIKQFWKTRVGDRYWFERSDPQYGFTIEQLNEIRKSSMARLFCDNGDDISHMQPRAFEKVSDRNPIMHCRNIPGVDLNLWKDYGPELAHKSELYFRRK